MIEQLQQLYEVQKLHLQIGTFQTQLAELDDGSAGRRLLAACEQKLAEEQAKLSATESELRDCELKLKSTEQERKQLKDRLYSGSIMNPKELQDVQAKIESLGRAKGSLEEQGLLLMDEVEAQSAAVATRQTESEQLRQTAERTEQTFREETDRLTALIADLEAQRATTAEPVQPALLSKYDRIRKGSQNLGLVLVETDLCPGCRTQITPHKLKRLRQPTELIHCDNCNRILYLPAAA